MISDKVTRWDIICGVICLSILKWELPLFVLDFWYIIGRLCVNASNLAYSLYPSAEVSKFIVLSNQLYLFWCLYSWKVHWSPARRHMNYFAVKLIVQDHQCSRMKSSSPCSSRCPLFLILWIFSTFAHFLQVPCFCISFPFFFWNVFA
jgi:hypothetical protein